MTLTLRQKIGVLWRNTSAEKVLIAAARLDDEGLHVPLEILERHHQSNGDISDAVEAFILAKKNKLDVSFETLAAIDFYLNGANSVRDSIAATVEEALAVRVHTIPKTEPLKVSTNDRINKVIQIKLSIRLLLERYVGGLEFESLAQRLIDSCRDLISKEISSNEFSDSLGKIASKLPKQNIDAGTRYEIISLEIMEKKS